MLPGIGRLNTSSKNFTYKGKGIKNRNLEDDIYNFHISSCILKAGFPPLLIKTYHTMIQL